MLHWILHQLQIEERVVLEREFVRNFGEALKWIMGGSFASIFFTYHQKDPPLYFEVPVALLGVFLLAVIFAIADIAFDPDSPRDLYGILSAVSEED